MLISDYSERTRRSLDNQNRLLLFLRDETWTSVPNAAMWLGLSLSAAYKCLARLERIQLIKPYPVVELNFTIWGITTTGLLHAWQDNELMQYRAHFEPSKIKPVMIQHHLDLQLARMKAQAAGWHNWQLGKFFPAKIGKRPDAVTESPSQTRVAVELERTVKTKKRYEAIFSIYLQAIKRGEFEYVHYVCPAPNFAYRLARLFDLVVAVPVAGTRVPISAKHRAKFQVYDLNHWPPDHETRKSVG